MQNNVSETPRTIESPRVHTHAGGSSGTGNNQTSRMGLLKTQRAVVFWSAEKEPEKPSVPWGSQLSVLAIVCWEPRPRPPLHRPISGPDETTPARAETAGGGRGLVVLAAARSTRRYTGLASTRSTQPRAPCCPRTAAVPRTTVKFGPMTVGSSQYRSCGAL